MMIRCAIEAKYSWCENIAYAECIMTDGAQEVYVARTSISGEGSGSEPPPLESDWTLYATQVAPFY